MTLHFHHHRETGSKNHTYHNNNLAWGNFFLALCILFISEELLFPSLLHSENPNQQLRDLEYLINMSQNFLTAIPSPRKDKNVSNGQPLSTGGFNTHIDSDNNS